MTEAATSGFLGPQRDRPATPPLEPTVYVERVTATEPVPDHERLGQRAFIVFLAGSIACGIGVAMLFNIRIANASLATVICAMTLAIAGAMVAAFATGMRVRQRAQ